MSGSRRSDDISVILYLVPFVVPGVYALYLWVSSGVSAYFPSSVYLAVTRDPTVFLVGTVALLAGMVIDVRGADSSGRRTKLASLSSMLQSMAVFSIFAVVASALYANGGDISGTADDILVGRFGLIFPALLVLLSYLASADFRVGSLRLPRTLGVIAMLLVPVVLYEVGKRQVWLGLAGAAVLVAIGVLLLVGTGRKAAEGSSK